MAVYSRGDVCQPELVTTVEQVNLGSGTVVNNRLYVTDHSGGLHTYDVSNPLQPILIDTQTPVEVLGGQSTTAIICLADNQGIVVFGIHNLTACIWDMQLPRAGFRISQ